MVEEFRIAAGSIEIIYNPIDIDRINELSRMPLEHPFFQGSAPVILAIGRLVSIMILILTTSSLFQGSYFFESSTFFWRYWTKASRMAI